MRRSYDVAVIGSGFAGSVLAWILARAGCKVLMLDRKHHPRFAIGESSTPVASLLLECMAEEYNLPPLSCLSRWGKWQQSLSNVRGGKKRGFSYFAHDPGERFSETGQHEASLLVAASVSDDVSDTHWLRSDVDQWLAKQAESFGVHVVAPAEVLAIRKSKQGECGRWQLSARVTGEKGASEENPEVWYCDSVVDSSGVDSPLATSLGIGSQDGVLNVRTSATFAHFHGVKSMDSWLDEEMGGRAEIGYPFSSDDAAQHHLLGNHGWMWMLRFSEGTTSVGIVRPETVTASQPRCSVTPLSILETTRNLGGDWEQTVKQFPTVRDLLADATLVAPTRGGQPGLGYIQRISRLREQAAGSGWIMLPSTAGIVDPLHSTGIAHGLSGVQRAARLILNDASDDAYQHYSQAVIDEVLWIDRIIDCCYRSLEDSFELFAASCSLYFVAAIHCERGLAQDGELRSGFLCEKSHELQRLVAWFGEQLSLLPLAESRSKARQQLIDALRERLIPWNDVGLMDPSLRNRIAKSTAPMRA